MKFYGVVRATAVAGFLVAMVVPAFAQLDLGGFFCSSLSIGCPPPPPPPPPPVVEPPPPPPVKHVRHVHKPKPKHAAAPKAESSTPPALAAAPADTPAAPADAPK